MDEFNKSKNALSQLSDSELIDKLMEIKKGDNIIPFEMKCDLIYFDELLRRKPNDNEVQRLILQHPNCFIIFDFLDKYGREIDMIIDGIHYTNKNFRILMKNILSIN